MYYNGGPRGYDLGGILIIVLIVILILYLV